METWQFSLFFAALLVGYVLVHLRVARFEQHLRALGTLRSIDDRLQELAAALPEGGDERLQRIEALLGQLHEDLEDLRETTAGVGEAVVHIPQPVSVQAAAGAAAEAGAALVPASTAERIRAVVETRLLQLGYSQLTLLTDLGSASWDQDTEVQVECERGHMPVKGRVLVRNGSVRDVAMQSVARTFP